MSSHAAENDIGKLKETLYFSLKNIIFFSIPASVGLMVLSRPIIRILFERDEFTRYATNITSSVLLFYTIGLVAYAGVKILVAAFHSMQDTVTPVKIAFLALLSNVILNIVLMMPLKAGGLALATSISGFINFGALFIRLRKKIGAFGEREILDFFVKVLVASLIMGIAAFFMMAHMPWAGTMRNLLTLLAIVCSSMAVYLIAALALKVHSAKALMSWIGKN